MATYPRRPHFTFEELQIPDGAKLYYKYDKNFSCSVLKTFRRVKYKTAGEKEEIETLTFLTKIIKQQTSNWSMHNFDGSPKTIDSLRHWYYDPDNRKHPNETLEKRKFRLENEKLSINTENEKQLLEKENKEITNFFVSNDQKSNNSESGNNEPNNSEQSQNESNNNKLRDNERDAVVKIRLNQGLFRKCLLTQWEDCCSVTGCTVQRMLIASHIKPWRLSNNKEQIDIFNGLLLTAHLDKAFDQGLVSFDDEGRIMISIKLIDSKKIGITQDMKLRMMFGENKKYLKYHREHIFKKQ